MSDKAPGPILVVDDDEDVLEFLKTTLVDAGFEVRTASCGASARRQIGEADFALILTDLRLPADSGLDLLALARQRSPLTVGVVISGHGTVESALEALREGAYDFLLKPCPPEVLLAAVRRALQHWSLKSELVRKTSELERLEGQLQHRSRLLHNVSHELRNPLSVVYGYSSYLLGRKAKACSPDEVQHGLRSIHTNAERLSALLEDLLDSARLANGKVSLARRPLAAARLVADAVDNFRLAARERHVRLSASGRCDPELTVHADCGKTHQVLSNLISNALRFTPAGGSIEVGAAADGGCGRFWVRDSGCGIPPQDLPRLFDRFYQAEDGKKSQKGLGLGLEICRGLVELHGGRIWVESAPGRGSAFHFTLPLAVDTTVETQNVLEFSNKEVS